MLKRRAIHEIISWQNFLQSVGDILSVKVCFIDSMAHASCVRAASKSRALAVILFCLNLATCGCETRTDVLR